MPPVSRGTTSAYWLVVLAKLRRSGIFQMFFTHPPPLRRRVLPFLSLSDDPPSLQNLASHILIQQRH